MSLLEAKKNFWRKEINFKISIADIYIYSDTLWNVERLSVEKIDVNRSIKADGNFYYDRTGQYKLQNENECQDQ